MPIAMHMLNRNQERSIWHSGQLVTATAHTPASLPGNVQKHRNHTEEKKHASRELIHIAIERHVWEKWESEPFYRLTFFYLQQTCI